MVDNILLLNYKKLLFIFTIVIIGLLSPLTNFVSAQSEMPSDDEVNAIARELYCPVCENVPLDVCPTQACAQWRELIREKLMEGWTEEQIKQYFVDQYGDRVLAQPPARGLNLLVYILPPVIFVGGVVLVYLNLKKIKKSPEKLIQDSKIDNEDEYLNEIEKALQDMSKSER
jgi:cytochrome c-type biogenesis protein CcmH